MGHKFLKHVERTKQLLFVVCSWSVHKLTCVVRITSWWLPVLMTMMMVELVVRCCFVWLQVDVCGFQLASKTRFRSAFEAVQLLTKVRLILFYHSSFSIYSWSIDLNLFPFSIFFFFVSSSSSSSSYFTTASRSWSCTKRSLYRSRLYWWWIRWTCLMLRTNLQSWRSNYKIQTVHLMDYVLFYSFHVIFPNTWAWLMHLLCVETH